MILCCCGTGSKVVLVPQQDTSCAMLVCQARGVLGPVTGCMQDIPWSTEAVLSTTLQHAAAAAIHVAPQAALPVLPDIDTEQVSDEISEHKDM